MPGGQTIVPAVGFDGHPGNGEDHWAVGGRVRSSAWVVEGGEGDESCLDGAGGIHRVLDSQPALERRTRGSEAKMLAGGRHTSPGSRSTASRPS